MYLKEELFPHLLKTPGLLFLRVLMFCGLKKIKCRSLWPSSERSKCGPFTLEMLNSSKRCLLLLGGRNCAQSAAWAVTAPASLRLPRRLSARAAPADLLEAGVVGRALVGLQLPGHLSRSRMQFGEVLRSLCEAYVNTLGLQKLG